MVNISNKKRKFIKRRFRQISIEELVRQTGLKPHVVRSLIDEYSAEVPRKDKPSVKVINDKVPFTERSMEGIVLAAIFIFLLILLIYIPALKNDFVNWDDGLYVYENINIQSLNFQSLRWMLTEFHAGLWLPLTWFSHAIDYAFWGLDPFGHHLTSIILHALNTLLVFFLVIRLLVKAKESNGMSLPSKKPLSNLAQALIVAGVTALIFGIHPLHVESVAWVAERKDVLCAFFFLLSLYFYISYTSTTHKRHRLRWFIIVLFLFLMALMSKPMAVTLPVTLLLLDVYPLKRIGRYSGNNLWVLIEKIPFFALSIASGVITIVAQSGGGAIKNIHPVARMLNALRSLVFYMEKMIWPVELAPFYPLPKSIYVFDIKYMISGIIVLAVTGGCFWMLKRGKSLFFIAWSYYVVTLFPTLGIIQVGSQAAADRFTYLPSISLFLLFGIGIAWASRQKVAFSMLSKISRTLIVVFTFTIISLLGYLTVKQIMIWRNSEIMWSYVISIFPNTHVAHNNLGNAYYKKGMLDEAIAEHKKALIIEPNYVNTYNKLALVFETQGKIRDAINAYREAIRLEPNHAMAYNNLAWIYATSPNATIRNGNEALALATKACELLDFEKAEGLGTLAAANDEQGNFKKTVEYQRKAIEMVSRKM